MDETPSTSPPAAGAAAAPHFALAPGDAGADPAAGPLLCGLADSAVVEFAGEDATSFLQGQFTADIAAMEVESWQLCGYCTPRGRLLALFELWRAGAGATEGYAARIPLGNAQDFLARIRRPILRARVRVELATARWSLAGLLGPGAAALLAQAAMPVPDRPWRRLFAADGTSVARLPAGRLAQERFVLAGPAGAMSDWSRRLAAAREVSPALWHWSGIEAAIPAIDGATRDAFVPQSVHLEVLGGVSFRKGCYPGQEVVARSQYLGKLRRRMALAHAGVAPSSPDVFHDSEAREAVGRIVCSAESPAGGVDLLVEGPSRLFTEGVLRAGSRDAAPLVIQPLPYELFDPTA